MATMTTMSWISTTNIPVSNGLLLLCLLPMVMCHGTDPRHDYHDYSVMATMATTTIEPARVMTRQKTQRKKKNRKARKIRPRD